MKHKKLLKKNELQKKLISAADKGDVEQIKACLANGADISADENGDYFTSNTALHITIRKNHYDAAIYLINHSGCNFELVAMAIEYKHYYLARLILMTIAYDISHKDHKSQVESILKSIENINDPDCIFIKKTINIELKLIRSKIDILFKNNKYVLDQLEEKLIKNHPYLLHEQFIRVDNDVLNTPLLLSILRNNNQIAKRLIELDSEKKSLDIAANCYMANNTPLILSLKRGNIEMAMFLIERGANVNVAGFRGFTPLHWACILRLDDIIELLILKGANVQTLNAFGKRAIDYYVKEITADDLSFSYSVATKSATPINTEDDELAYTEMKYDDSDVRFVKTDRTFHKEVTMHSFATKVPDYSDLYWHIEAILKNSGLHHMIDNNLTMNDDDAEHFNLYGRYFIEERSKHPVQEHLIKKLKNITHEQSIVSISLFNNSEEIEKTGNLSLTH